MGPQKLRWPRAPRSLNPSLRIPRTLQYFATVSIKYRFLVWDAFGISEWEEAVADDYFKYLQVGTACAKPEGESESTNVAPFVLAVRRRPSMTNAGPCRDISARLVQMSVMSYFRKKQCVFSNRHLFSTKMGQFQSITAFRGRGCCQMHLDW